MKLHSIIERILVSDSSLIKDLISAYEYFDFTGDDLKVFSAIRSVEGEFSFLSMFDKFKQEDKERLIALCMDSYISRSVKNIVDSTRGTAGMEYINVFK